MYVGFSVFAFKRRPAFFSPKTRSERGSIRPIFNPIYTCKISLISVWVPRKKYGGNGRGEEALQFLASEEEAFLRKRSSHELSVISLLFPISVSSSFSPYFTTFFKKYINFLIFFNWWMVTDSAETTSPSLRKLGSLAQSILLSKISSSSSSSFFFKVNLYLVFLAYGFFRLMQLLLELSLL